MNTLALGDLPVHRIGLGAMQLLGLGATGPPRDHDAAIAVLRRAVELGVVHVDTPQSWDWLGCWPTATTCCSSLERRAWRTWGREPGGR